MRRRRVTFSRNLTLSLSRTCQCYCKYCAFATHQPHLHEPHEVLEILDRGVSRHRAKELLVLTGEKPEHNAFEQQLARDPTRARAQCGSDCQLGLAALRAHQQEIGDIGARDQEYETDTSHQHP